MVNIFRAVVTAGAAGAAAASTSAVREASAEALHAPASVSASPFVPLGPDEVDGGWDFCDCEIHSVAAPSRDETMAAKRDLLTSIQNGSLQLHENAVTMEGTTEDLSASFSSVASAQSAQGAPTEVAVSQGMNMRSLVLRVGADIKQRRAGFAHNNLATRALDAFERDPELQDVVCELAQDRRVLGAIASNPKVQQLLRRRGPNLLPEIPVEQKAEEVVADKEGEQEAEHNFFADVMFFFINEVDKMRRFCERVLNSILGDNDEAAKAAGEVPTEGRNEFMSVVVMLVVMVVCIVLVRRPMGMA